METTILMVGNKDEKFIQTISDNKDYKIIAVANEEAAIEKLHHEEIEIIVLSNDLLEEDKNKLKAIQQHQFPELQVISFEGNDAIKFTNEINKMMKEKNSSTKTNYSFLDDVFKGDNASE